MTPEKLAASQLYRACDPADLGFATTADVPDMQEVIGQPRAVEAMRFGIDIRRQGYNIFVLGPQGAGRYTLIGEFLNTVAAAEPKPDDWCYVHNFVEPNKPAALRLPPGRALPLRAAMAHLVADLRVAIPAAFDSDDYLGRRRLVEEQLKARHSEAFRGLRGEAEAVGLTVIQTPEGFVFVPLKDGRPMPPQDFAALPPEQREAAAARSHVLEGRLETLMRQSQGWQKETLESLRAINSSTAGRVVAHLLEPLRRDFTGFPDVLAYFRAVEDDIVRNAIEFLRAAAAAHAAARASAVPDGAGAPGEAVQALVQAPNELIAGEDPLPFRRYQINVVVDNGNGTGAPVVYEDLPSVPGLIGRTEHAAQFGQLVTDFTLIKPGALHRANGGYLIVDARKLLLQPMAYEELKRVLLARQIRIESLAQRSGIAPIATLEPQPIPFDAKIVMVGEPSLYYALAGGDPEFLDLFKVQAELADRMARTPEMTAAYARLIATLGRREQLRPLEAAAVARIVDHGARMVEDSERLSARFAHILDLMREADYWAGETGAALIDAGHVERALGARNRRSDRLREVLHEQILRGAVLVDTAGARVGQVNGLSVMQLGNFSFGKPSRISARVRVGRGEIVDIERQVELGGPLHSKGVLILAGYLGAKYAADAPLALSATLGFEQSYGGVDGDSASSAELYALLSALAELPVRQGLAVTGSVNQVGEVQAIGGVNDKIEGFFDICAARGLSGEQGVMIPAVNTVNLMLRRNVVEAVAAGRFSIYPIRRIDDGIALLTGVPAGEQDAGGAWTAGSVNARVAARLAAFLAAARRHFRSPGADPAEDGDTGA